MRCQRLEGEEEGEEGAERIAHVQLHRAATAATATTTSADSYSAFLRRASAMLPFPSHEYRTDLVLARWFVRRLVVSVGRSGLCWRTRC